MSAKRRAGIVSAAYKAGSVLLEHLESRQLLSTTVASPTFVLQNQLGTTRPLATTAANGLSPATVRAAYGVNGILFGSITGDGAGQTIAIVDAYDAPTLISDLAIFNSQFGLQQFNVAGGPTLTKIGQNGTANLPGTDPAGPGSSWAVETSLDVEWAHAIAPKANIVVVEANSASNTNLFTAVDTARNRAGVSVVSMSFGATEFSGDTAYEFHFTTPSGHQGVTFIASAGDDGAYDRGTTNKAVQYPAASLNVLAIGGTKLTVNGTAYVSETAWGSGTTSGTQGGAGGGLSTVFAEPSRQRSLVTQTTTQRAVPDVAWLADPASGVAVIDTWDNPTSPWLVVGGTSLSAPMWAGLIGIANQGRVLSGQGTLDGPAASTGTLAKIYGLPATDFRDITTGNNGFAAGTGFDLVTGRGTPIPASVVRDLASSSATPVIGNFVGTPNPLSAGTPLTLTATGVQETGGTIARVLFYRESNGISSVQTSPVGGDVQVGSIVAAGTTFTLTGVSTTGLTPGVYTFYAVAVDANGAQTAAATNVTVTVAVSPTPTIGSFTATPSPVTSGVPINLTATGVTEPGGTISTVRFYEETNGTTGLQTGTGTDTFLGAGTASGTTYTLTNYPTSGFAPGTYTLYALATDANGATLTATTTVTVTAPVIPGNDSFAGATVLTGTSIAVTGSNLAATKETGEPAHAGNAGGRSVWWTWTPAASGKVTVTTTGSSFDTLLGVYTGTAVSALTKIASNDDQSASVLTSAVSFTALAGTKYYFAVDGYNGASGNISLNLSQSVASPFPANDLFANATVQTAATFAFSGTNIGATRQSGEPLLNGNSGGASVWVTWTAPTTRTVTLNTAGSNFDTMLGVYTGAAVNTLTFVAGNDDANGLLTSALTFNAVAGTTYRFVIDGYNGATGNYNLNLL